MRQQRLVVTSTILRFSDRQTTFCRGSKRTRSSERGEVTAMVSAVASSRSRLSAAQEDSAVGR
eukprot:3941036-Rhodomonas_salina.4